MFSLRVPGFNTQEGFPIRTSPDQRLLATSRSLSQLATSFIAILHQGIHRMPLVAWYFFPNYAICTRIKLSKSSALSGNLPGCDGGEYRIRTGHLRLARAALSLLS